MQTDPTGPTEHRGVYDGWTHGSTHYVGLYASYTVDITERVNNCERNRSVPRLTLLGKSPLSGPDSEREDNDHEAVTFGEEAHIRYFCEAMRFYDLNFSTWTKCLIADNRSVNRRIASITAKPHIGCVSHKLNLEVHYMITEYIDLSTTITDMHETMRVAKSRLFCEISLR